MTPKDKINFYDDLARKLKVHSLEKMREIFSEYKFPFQHVNPTITKHQYATQVLAGLSKKNILLLAKDFEVEVPNGFIQQKKATLRTMPLKQIQSADATKQIFISHSSLDKDVVEKVIDYLIAMGVSHKSIFCSSFEGYGILVGDNFLDTIKEKISSNTLVLFILSPNFYESPVSLCEMGAAWVNSKEHVPMLIPPFEFVDIKGVIPLTQGLKIDDKQKLNSLKVRIERFLSLDPMDVSIWERKRDSIFNSIQPILQERVKPNARVISAYNKILSDISDEEKTVLNAIHKNKGLPLGMDNYMTENDYGDDIIRNLERLHLVEASNEPDMWNFYHLTMFGLNMMNYINKQSYKTGRK